MKIITNNIPRFTIDAYELSEKERKEFDYLNWEAIGKGEDSATFFRYKGQVYDLGEFMHVDYPDGELKGWHGISSQSAFHAIIVKFPDNDMDSVIVGQYFS